MMFSMFCVARKSFIVARASLQPSAGLGTVSTTPNEGFSSDCNKKVGVNVCECFVFDYTLFWIDILFSFMCWYHLKSFFEGLDSLWLCLKDTWKCWLCWWEMSLQCRWSLLLVSSGELWSSPVSYSWWGRGQAAAGDITPRIYIFTACHSAQPPSAAQRAGYRTTAPPPATTTIWTSTAVHNINLRTLSRKEFVKKSL